MTELTFIGRGKADEVNAHHDAVQQSLGDAFEHAASAGELLRTVKSTLPHGEFTKWIESYVNFSVRTAQGYMKWADEYSCMSKAERLKLIKDPVPLKSLLYGTTQTPPPPPPIETPNDSPVEGLSTFVAQQIDSGALTASREQLESLAREYDEDSQNELVTAVIEGRTTIDNAIEYGEVPEVPIEERIKEQAKEIESFARYIMKEFKDKMPSDPWLISYGGGEKALIAKMTGLLTSVRDAKCTDVCPKCEGEGCSTCLETGMIPAKIRRAI